MENIDKADLIAHLNQIGFQQAEEDLEIMEYFDGDHLVLHVTLGGGNIIYLEDHQKKQIASQCKLKDEEFEKLAVGKLTAKQYEKILHKQGLV